MKKGKFVLTWISVLLLCLLFVSCSSTPTPTAAPAPKPTSAPSTTPSPAPKPTSSPSATQTAIKLDINMVVPLGPGTTAPGIEYFAKEVNKRSQGRINVVLHPANELGLPGNQVLQLLKEGKVIKMSEVIPGYFFGVYTPLTVTNLFGIKENLVDALLVDRAQLPILNEDLAAKWDTVILGGYNYSNAPFFSKKPLKTLDDFKGIRMRTFTADIPEVLKRLGGAGVSGISTAEMYAGIQRGVIDSAHSAALYAKTFKLGEVTPYVDFWPTNFMPNYLAMQKSYLESLPPDLRGVITDTASDLRNFWNASVPFAVADERAMLKEINIKVVDPAPEEIAKFKKISRDVVDEMATKFDPVSKKMLDVEIKIVAENH